MITIDFERSITICELEDGTRISYDAASINRHSPLFENFEYIGRGKIYSVNGIRQAGIQTLHFFKRKVVGH